MTLAEHEDTLRVDEVSRGGQAHKRGVVAGDVLVRVGDTPCEATSLEAAVAIIEAAPRPVTLRFRRHSGAAGGGRPPATNQRVRDTQPRARDGFVLKPQHLLMAAARNDSMDFLVDVIQDQIPDQDQDQEQREEGEGVHSTANDT